MIGADQVASMADGGHRVGDGQPDPEIDPAVAAKHAAVVATGRSDFPNQINNVLAFPGFFRGLLDAGGARTSPRRCWWPPPRRSPTGSADESLNASYIVPSVFDPHVAPAVAEAVIAASDAGRVAQPRCPRRSAPRKAGRMALELTRLAARLIERRRSSPRGAGLHRVDCTRVSPAPAMSCSRPARLKRERVAGTGTLDFLPETAEIRTATGPWLRPRRRCRTAEWR